MHPSFSPLSLASLSPSLGGEGGGDAGLIAGVLSGTSADGIDVVLAHAVVGRASGNGAPTLAAIEGRAFATEPFDVELGRRVRAVLGGESIGLGALAALDRDLGLAFGRAARAVAQRHDIGRLALVASHGQTVFHHDGDGALGKVTLQLGDGDFVAEAAGAPVVSDFRVRDCAAGGEGAPLVGLVDDVLFAAAPRPLAILNLGGISNWTILAGEGRPACAFDAGPAGALLDGLCRYRLERPFDDGGQVAAAGAPDDAWVEGVLGHPKVEALRVASGPRSTGRDTFDEAWVKGLAAARLTAEDLLASSCRVVAMAAAQALARELCSGPNPPPESIVVSLAGGGIHNRTLRAELESALRSELEAVGVQLSSLGTSDALGVAPDAREALAFAALGARFVLGEPSTSKAATGASPGRILGKWSPSAAPGSQEFPGG